MVFNITITPSQPGSPAFSVQIEAPDLIAALEGAKAPILKSARDSQAILAAALPTQNPSPLPAPTP